MSTAIGLALGLVILGGVAFFALRADDKPLRRNEGLRGLDATEWSSGKSDGSDLGGGSSGHHGL